MGIDGSANSTKVQKQLNEESSKHGDIIQIGMIDRYYNITMKVFGLLNWLDRHCSKADFVLKLDDDVYLNVRNLVTTLKTLDPTLAGIYGVPNPFLSVVRENSNDMSSNSF